jgi:putative transposase
VDEYVEDRADMHGIDVDHVDTGNTSRRCSLCGFTHPDNWDGEAFECPKCGDENHADYNAAKNVVSAMFVVPNIGDGAGAPVGVHFNRGTLHAHGEAEQPAGDSRQTGRPRESPPATKRPA